MINSKIIYNRILEDSKISKIIPEDNIFDAYPSSVENFPCIIFLDSNQVGTEYADNKPTVQDCSVNIHIFTKTDSGFPTTSEIGEIVDEIFTDKDFVCTNNTEITDVQPNVRHRVMIFSGDVFLN